MQWNNATRQRGGIMIVACILAMVFILTGAALYMFTLSEARAAERERDELRALALADAGLERVLNDLRLDLQDDVYGGSWADGLINGIACQAGTEQYTMVSYTGNQLGTGTYMVELRLAADRNDETWARVTGMTGSRRAAVQAYVRARDLSPWNNAIYAGVGGGGTLINGHVRIAGSVHILGDTLAATDLAMDMSGSAAIINNYAGMPAELVNAVAPCPKVTQNGTLVDSLSSEVRVRRGRINLSGSGLVGQPDNAGNTLKETMDGVFTNDGFGGTDGVNNVYSDNGADTAYDFEDWATFPRLSEPYDGYGTYMEYLQSNAYVISQNSKLNDLRLIRPGSTFSYVDPEGKGSIVMAGGKLTVSGIVYVDGDLGMGNPGASDTITYSGRGTLVVAGNVKMCANLYPLAAGSYPSQNIIAVMTPNNIDFGGAQTKVSGLFYAEQKITASKQTTVAGTFVSNWFDMGSNVPSIYQVPMRRQDYPPGLIGATPRYTIGVLFWEKLPVAQQRSYTYSDQSANGAY